MFLFTIFALLAVSATYSTGSQSYSFQSPVGSGSGSSYSLAGTGRITAVRVWERASNYILGFQFRYGFIWSPVAGFQYGSLQELQLFEGEALVQVSGTYLHYVQSLVFVTNRGRSLFAGQPHGRTFNMYPEDKMAELRFVSGRYHGAITSFGTHWGVVTNPYSNNNPNASHY